MPVEFSEESLNSAQAGAKRMLNAKATEINDSFDITTTEEYKQFVNAMDDDMNTSKALAVLFDLVNKANKDEENAYTLLVKLGSVLGFNFTKTELTEEELQEKINAVSMDLDIKLNSMEEIIEIRKNARAEKNWDLADKIRISLDKVGIILKDSKDGTTWELKK